MQYLCQLSLWTRLSIMLQVLNRRAEIAERVLEREKSYLTTLASLILFHVFVLVGSLFTDRETLPDYLACENNNNSNNNKEAKKGGCFLRVRLSRSLLDTNRICRSPRMATPFIFEKKCLEYLPMYSGGWIGRVAFYIKDTRTVNTWHFFVHFAFDD